MRIHYGPGFRVYFIQRGKALVILLAGGDKQTQEQDIATAIELARQLQGRTVMALQTTRWDSTEYLQTDEDIAAYLDAVLEEDDPALVTHALAIIARAKGMTQLADEAGLSRENLCQALSPEGKPEFATVLRVVRALGLQLHAAPRVAASPPAAG